MASLEQDDSGGRRWAAAAAVARQEADAAHAAAATEIVAFNRQHKEQGAFELDLHGLHVKEALQALWARVQGTRFQQQAATKPPSRLYTHELSLHRMHSGLST
jgi:hypothetical protein